MTINITTITTESELGKAFVELIKQRETWEAGTYAASNAELYSLLGQTLDLLYRVKRFTELSRGLNGLLTELGFKFTSATSTETKLLRTVFGNPTDPDQYKQRIYVYTRVLAVAYEKKITGAELPAFIAEHGGIDEIRRHEPKAASKAEAEKLILHTAEKTLTVADRRTIATGIQLTAELQPADDQHFSIALVRMEADGTGSIVYGTNNVALVRSVLAIAGREIDADAEDDRKRRIAAQIQAEREAYLALARAELTARDQTSAAEVVAASAVENFTA
jgi:hypothetical protein